VKYISLWLALLKAWNLLMEAIRDWTGYNLGRAASAAAATKEAEKQEAQARLAQDDVALRPVAEDDGFRRD
jgi:hypothetical protein